MFGWLKRMETGTTTWRDAQAAGMWLAAMWFVGFVMGAVLVGLVESSVGGGGRAMAVSMDDVQAQLTVRDYVCARCWGPLALRPARREGVRLMMEVFCAAHPEHEGFVRKGWAERRAQEALGEAAEARYNLGAALGLEGEEPEIWRKAKEDPLKALGF